MSAIVAAPVPIDLQAASSASHWIDITYAVEEALKEIPR